MWEMVLNEKEKAFVEEVRDFVRSIPSDLLRAMDENKVQYPREFLEEAGRRNLLGPRFPVEVGGRGLSWKAEMAAIEEVGALGAALSCLYVLPSIVGEAIVNFGTKEQIEQYVRPMLKGKKFVAEALTEPRGGSDFFGAQTKAKLEGDYFVLNGQKRFIVGAEGADFFAVYARTGDGPGKESISLILVDRGDGVLVRKVYNLMGTRGGGTGRLVFKDAKVPKENLVGGLNMGAVVFNQMMIPERMTSAAGAIGSARAAVEVAARYATKRKAFGRPIRKFEAVSFMIANAVGRLDAARGLNFMAAEAVDQDRPYKRRLVSEAKKEATEAAWYAVNNAMQVMGGIGYTSVYPVEKLLRDIRLLMIWTGTNEIMNLLIQHEYFKEVEKGGLARDVEADAMDPDPEEKVFE